VAALAAGLVRRELGAWARRAPRPTELRRRPDLDIGRTADFYAGGIAGESAGGTRLRPALRCVASGMAGIFISYRREDAAGHAGRLFDGLRARFDQVFLDVSGIDAGVDFVEAISDAVGGCDLLLVVMGRQWLPSTDARGRRRIDDPSDFVHIEVKAALERGIRVIPVLVEGALMPSADELPQPLQPLARRQAFELRDTRWEADVEGLVDQIRGVLRAPAKSPPARERAPRPPRSYRTLWFGVGALLLAALLFGGTWLLLRTVEVPQMALMPLDKAAPVLESFGLEVGEVTHRTAVGAIPGTIVEQSPPPGTEVRRGTSIDLVVAEVIRLPYVVGLDARTAREQLSARGLHVQIEERAIPDARPGVVLEQWPPSGTELTGDAPPPSARLVVATAPPAPAAPAAPATPSQPAARPKVAVPNLLGLDRAGGAAALKGAGLVAEARHRETPSRPAGTIIEQSPAPGERVAPGTRVGVTFAKAPAAPPPAPERPPARVSVRTVTGLELANARQALERQGLKVGELSRRTTDAAAPGTVVEQKPAGGEAAAPGSAVDLVVAARAPAADPAMPHAGDTWRYRYTSAWPNIPRKVMVHRVLDATRSQIRESVSAEGGGEPDVKVFSPGVEIVTRTVGGVTLDEFAPFLQAFSDPEQGWRKTGIPPPRGAQFSSGWSITARYVIDETVSVPAGNFKATRIDVRGRLLGAPPTAAQQVESFEYRVWYAPEVKRVVKYERDSFSQSNAPLDRDRYELLDYRVR
jgi:beta-lactam-binding protein with PASTA domain